MISKNTSVYRYGLAAYISVKNYALLIIFCATCATAKAQVKGCTDPAADNYNTAATINDGSCTYKDVSIKAVFNTNLNTKLNETSGLLWWNNMAWTHNDSGGEPALYAVDTATGKIIKKVTIKNATNVDWEDIAQDNTYLYIGDFGNNANGNRRDLKIYKVKKADVSINTAVKAIVISFSYNDQTNFNAAGSNNTNFDCEALIAYGDSLFLFSKDWVDNKTRLYKLPKAQGTYTAINIGELNVQGLITGADIINGKRVIVLSGYDALVTPFIYLLYDFTGNHFFAANKRKVGIKQNFLQDEGICAVSDTSVLISNERFESLVTTKAKLQTLNLANLLHPYYASQNSKAVPKVKYIIKASLKKHDLSLAK